MENASILLLITVAALVMPAPSRSQVPFDDPAVIAEAEASGICGEVSVYGAFYREDGALIVTCNNPLVDLTDRGPMPLQTDTIEFPQSPPSQ